jgi:ectoine hydroxylase-related dioxygenase (phytanoyl-CoA dioxygenase family)
VSLATFAPLLPVAGGMLRCHPMPASHPWPRPDEAAVDPRAAFDQLGAAALGRVFDDIQLATVRNAFEAIQSHGVTGPYARIVHDAWRKSPTLAALVPHLGALAAAALDIPALVLFHDHLLTKFPAGDDMSWHQDFSYLPLDRPDGLTLWIALDDVTEENGCLYYILGSHRLGERRAAWGMTGDDDPRAALPPIDVADDDPGVPVPTAAACAIAHHTYLLHRSPRNRGTRPRRTWALSFVTPDARWSPRHSPHPRSIMEHRDEGQALEADLLRAGPLLAPRDARF